MMPVLSVENLEGTKLTPIYHKGFDYPTFEVDNIQSRRQSRMNSKQPDILYSVDPDIYLMDSTLHN